MKPFIFHPEANEEALAAADWYQQEAGLGDEFLAAVASTIDKLCADPSSHQIIRKNVRRRRVLSFPYDVVFEDEPDLVRVIAISHHRRRSRYWRHRQSGA